MRHFLTILFIFGLVACSSSKKPEDPLQDIGIPETPDETSKQTANNGETVTYPAPKDLGDDFTCFMGGENGTPVPCDLNDQGEIVVTVPEGVVGEDLDICVMGADGPCQSIGKITIEPNLPANNDGEDSDPEPTPLLCQQTGCPEGFTCDTDGTCQSTPTPKCPDDITCASEEECGADSQCHPKTQEVINPDPPTSSDAECDTTDDCKDSSKKCFNQQCITKVCGVDFQCDPGEECNEKNSFCQPINAPKKIPPPKFSSSKMNSTSGPDAYKNQEAITAIFVDSGSDKTSELHSIVLGAVRLKWQVKLGGQGVEEAYLYGPFNRTSTDEDCGAIYPQHGLAININKDNPPSSFSQLEDYPNVSNDSDKSNYLHGERCDRGNCHEYSNYFDDSYAGPIICKIDLMPLLTPKKIKEGSLWEDFFYTRVHVPDAKFVLMVKSKNGGWAYDTFQTNQVPLPKISSDDSKIISFNTSPSDRSLHVDINFKNILKKPQISGCTESGGGDLLNVKGEYHYVADCPVEKLPLKINVVAQGIGGAKKTREFFVNCSDPELSIKKGSFTPSEGYTISDGPGQQGLIGTAKLICTIGDDTKNTSSKIQEASLPHWIKYARLEVCDHSDVCSTPGTVDILSGQDLYPIWLNEHGPDKHLILEKALLRNHQFHQYRFTVHGLNEKIYQSDILDIPYLPLIETDGSSSYNDGNGFNCHYLAHLSCQDFDGENECDYDSKTKEFGDDVEQATFIFNFKTFRIDAIKLQHIKNVQLICNDVSGIKDWKWKNSSCENKNQDDCWKPGNLEIDDADSYKEQIYSFRMSSENRHAITCQFRGIGYDNKQYTSDEFTVGECVSMGYKEFHAVVNAILVGIIRTR